MFGTLWKAFKVIIYICIGIIHCVDVVSDWNLYIKIRNFRMYDKNKTDTPFTTGRTTTEDYHDYGHIDSTLKTARFVILLSAISSSTTILIELYRDLYRINLNFPICFDPKKKSVEYRDRREFIFIIVAFIVVILEDMMILGLVANKAKEGTGLYYFITGEDTKGSFAFKVCKTIFRYYVKWEFLQQDLLQIYSWNTMSIKVCNFGQSQLHGIYIYILQITTQHRSETIIIIKGTSRVKNLIPHTDRNL